MDWQDIESAPKDGETVDLWVEDSMGGYRVANGYWCDFDGHWRHHGDAGKPRFNNPTHWMPLPSPPEQPE